MASPESTGQEEMIMPFINIKVKGPLLSAEQSQKLHDGVGRLVVDVLGKKLERTAIIIDQPSGLEWSVGGKVVEVGAHMEATIMTDSNSVDEKARFIEKAYSLLATVLGSALSPVTFVVLRELPADSWGFCGKSNAYREEYLNSK